MIVVISVLSAIKIYFTISDLVLPYFMQLSREEHTSF